MHIRFDATGVQQQRSPSQERQPSISDINASMRHMHMPLRADDGAEVLYGSNSRRKTPPRPLAVACFPASLPASCLFPRLRRHTIARRAAVHAYIQGNYPRALEVCGLFRPRPTRTSSQQCPLGSAALASTTCRPRERLPGRVRGDQQRRRERRRADAGRNACR